MCPEKLDRLSSGRGINDALLTLMDERRQSRTARTNTFGYYWFENLRAGAAYVIKASAKRYEFAPQVINLNEDLTSVNFSAY